MLFSASLSEASAAIERIFTSPVHFLAMSMDQSVLRTRILIRFSGGRRSHSAVVGID